MSRSVWMLAVALLATQAFAAPQRAAGRGVAVTSWVQRATTSDLMQETNALSWEAMSNRPVALIETNYYTFLPGEPLQVRITTNANGYAGPVTMYLYWENRTTGERRYYNAGAGALLPAGRGGSPRPGSGGAGGSPAALLRSGADLVPGASAAGHGGLPPAGCGGPAGVSSGALWLDQFDP